MAQKFKVLIAGNGRIARAIAHYYNARGARCQASFLVREAQVKRCDLLVGALPGELGEQCLRLALKYRKNLLDVSDIDPPFYLKKKKQIADAGITVIPGCGFSPGLVNFLLGRELFGLPGVRSITVKSGSLSRNPAFFPFLWCFEDLVLEHQIPSWQRLNGVKKKFPAFAGYQREKFFGIDSETYYCASGFENVMELSTAPTITYRVIRPVGFAHFFSYLQQYGFVSKENMMITKRIVEAEKVDNISLAEIIIANRTTSVRWVLKSQSRAEEMLNSMQKMTASVTACMGRLLLAGGVNHRGLMFMEELGQDRQLFTQLLSDVRQQGIMAIRTSSGNRQ